MPNGGLHHCANCWHFEQESSRCSLRNIPVELPYWITCRDMNKGTDVPHGPVYSIVCEVKDGAGGYSDIPWFQGNRVDTVQAPSGGETIVVVTDRNRKRHEFSDVNAYVEFWRENTPKEEQ